MLLNSRFRIVLYVVRIVAELVRGHRHTEVASGLGGRRAERGLRRVGETDDHDRGDGYRQRGRSRQHQFSETASGGTDRRGHSCPPTERGTEVDEWDGAGSGRNGDDPDRTEPGALLVTVGMGWLVTTCSSG